MAACSNGDKAVESKLAAEPAHATGAAPHTAHNPAFDKLIVTSDGKPVVMERAFIKRASPDQWRILVGDREGSCEELLSGVTNRQPGGTSFVASIARRLKPDGSEAMVVSDFWSAGHPTDSVTGAAKVTGELERGARIEVELGKITDVDKTRKLEIAGTFTAIGCGAQATPAAGLPKVPHPSTAAVTIAGKRVKLVSATRSGDAILVTSGPRDCSSPTVPAQATIQHRYGKWELAGTWFAEPSESTDRALGEDKTKDLVLTAGAAGTGADGATVALTLGGTGKLGEYPIAFEGTIEALDCAK